jgi:23S rRNA (adenine2503-C2)-methyltransferase
MGKVNLKELSGDEISTLMKSLGEPQYRARQLLHWLYSQNAASISDISVFSKALRSALSELAYISRIKTEKRLKDKDGTEKLLFRLEDGLAIESVIIPEEDRLTLCVSSQVGCAMGCRFCKTASMGFLRNLKAHEIVGQYLAVSDMLKDRKITNIVFMGMGEPMKNLDEVVSSLKILSEQTGFPLRRVTVSTSGIVPGIKKLAGLGLKANLAVSLNAATDKVRDAVMPINRRYPINRLIDACREFPLGKGRKITFEYVLLKGVNDHPSESKNLVSLIKGMNAKVNLIPFNDFEGSAFEPPSENVVLAFQEILARSGIHVFIRKSRGGEIQAACGQLWSERNGAQAE